MSAPRMITNDEVDERATIMDRTLEHVEKSALA
jgi:hypothetical protein